MLRIVPRAGGGVAALSVASAVIVAMGVGPVVLAMASVPSPVMRASFMRSGVAPGAIVRRLRNLWPEGLASMIAGRTCADHSLLRETARMRRARRRAGRASEGRSLVRGTTGPRLAVGVVVEDLIVDM